MDELTQVQARFSELEASGDQIAEECEKMDALVMRSFGTFTPQIAFWEQHVLGQLAKCCASENKKFGMAEQQNLLSLHYLRTVIKVNSKSIRQADARDKVATFIPWMPTLKSCMSQHNYTKHILSPIRPVIVVWDWIPKLVNEPSSSESEMSKACVVHNGKHPIARECDTITDVVKMQIGGEGSEPGKFHDPNDVAIHPVTGNIYVTDSANNRIQVFTPNLEFIEVFKVEERVQFKYPRSLEFSGDGQTLFVACSNEMSCIWVLRLDGSLVRVSGCPGVWKGLSGEESEEPEIKSPFFMTVDEDDYFYVADCNQGCVMKYSVKGEFVCKIGDESSKAPIGEPYGLVVNDAGQLLVVEGGNQAVLVFNRDGEFIEKHSIEMTCYGNGMARSFDEGFIVTDYWRSTIFFYDKGFQLLKKISCKGASGCRFSGDGRLYVAQVKSHLVCCI